ncbi:uncharacterized protein LOC117903128 isoform X2 [Drosophila subobscura]|uniref:uncharacterized protein LOC117903128 isoform X2 n=1 Tax=Drosophila subobscura TaxID=7241 RepID=UPI00155B08BA|nr:uncharacterized protein LOC117903128 isoform X2 [Drosophila subobscura]
MNISGPQTPRATSGDALDRPIRPLGFDLQELRFVIELSPLRHACPFLFATENIYEIMDGFNLLMDSETIAFGAGPQGALMVAGMMVYLLNHAELQLSHVKRTLFLQRCFNYMACTEETHVNDLCVYILKKINIRDSDHMLNLILCCHDASPLCTMAQLVCNCLLWAVLDWLTDMGTGTHRLRPYSELKLAISLVNPSVCVESFMHGLNLTVRAVSALLVVGPYGNTEQICHDAGVSPTMFVLPDDDASFVFRWLSAVVNELRHSMGQADGHMEERIAVLEVACELMLMMHEHLLIIYQRLRDLDPEAEILPLPELPEPEMAANANANEAENENENNSV